jgi:hypothetical protein
MGTQDEYRRNAEEADRQAERALSTSLRDRKQELEAKLAKYRAMAQEFSLGVTSKNINELADEVEQELRALDK